MEQKKTKSLLNDEWDYIEPKGSIYRIEKFDDGNNNYSKYFNEWVIYGRLGGGKVSIMNNKENNIIIKSISQWKLNKVY